MACNGYTRQTSVNAGNGRGCPPISSTYAQCGTGTNCDGAGAPCKEMYNTATVGRSNMQGLNDRLAGFLNNLKGLQSQPGVDPSKYRQAMATLENEMMNLKGGYEAELARLRKALEDCCREKNNLSMNINSYGTSVADLQKRVKDLEAQLQRCQAENQGLCGKLAGKDKEIADLACCLKRYQDELGAIKPDYDRLKREGNDSRARLDSELKCKNDELCRLKQLLDKCQFDNGNKDQQIADLTNRLRSKDEIITSLENKIRQLSSNNGSNVNGLLQKMRDDTMNEMRRQQQASEDALNKSLQALRCQIDTDAKDKDGLLREQGQYKDQLTQLKAKISDLEGRLTAACTENAQLKAELDRERACCQQAVRALEQKLRELHEQMMSKIKECNQARDQQVSLNAEITNYKSLLDVADTKVREAMSQSAAQPTYNTSSSATMVAKCTTDFPPPSRGGGFCRPQKPSEILGASLGGGGGGACCTSCTTGDVCDSTRPAYGRTTTAGVYGSRNNRITANYPGNGSFRRPTSSSVGNNLW